MLVETEKGVYGAEKPYIALNSTAPLKVLNNYRYIKKVFYLKSFKVFRLWICQDLGLWIT